MTVQEISANTAETEEIIEFVEKPIYNFFKRAFDILSTLIASIILLVPIIIISAIIVANDGWNPIYQHKRIGKNGRSIGVYKFRSMKNGADNLEKMLTPEQLEEYKKEYKLKDDPRLIGYKNAGDGNKCFGAKLRRMSIDELPQILMNILILGNMSVVGPRPILESELKENYTPAQQKLLLSVKPGLTGYWQAYARNNVGYENGERQKMELFYVQNRSFMLDMKIIFKTIITVLKRTGAK
ncbi:MAG: sugar transferase [Oscillospiraceae bacterium]|nr:sugar transferase [Oscillospiraceae bacterium]